jgi:hypothetical protein
MKGGLLLWKNPKLLKKRPMLSKLKRGKPITGVLAEEAEHSRSATVLTRVHRLRLFHSLQKKPEQFICAGASTPKHLHFATAHMQNLSKELIFQNQ